jgi:hypothetical protein
MNMITEASEGKDTTPVSFEAQQTGVLRKQKWTVRLASDSAEFSSSKSQERVSVPRNQGNEYIQFASAFVSGYNMAVKQRGKTYKFKLMRDDLAKLRSWLPTKTVADMKQELRNWGIGLILLGVAHFVLAGFLDPVWGVAIIVIGVLNLLIPQRGLFILNGMALLWVGTLNIFSAVTAIAEGGGQGWIVFGILQLIWGIQEMRKFKQYASATETPPSLAQTEASKKVPQKMKPTRVEQPNQRSLKVITTKKTGQSAVQKVQQAKFDRIEEKSTPPNPSTPTKEPKICPKCDKNNRAGNRYCIFCGASLIKVDKVVNGYE